MVFLKGVYRLARDLELSMSVVNGEVVAETEGEPRELLLLLGQNHACQVMRAQTANAFAFSGGDKVVDESKQPEHWAGLEEGLKAVYKQPEIANLAHRVLKLPVLPSRIRLRSRSITINISGSGFCPIGSKNLQALLYGPYSSSLRPASYH